MKIVDIIKEDLRNAKNNKENISKFALESLLEVVSKLRTKKEIRNVIEREIEAKGQKILRISKTKSIKKVETDIYLMNFYNSYLCRYFFNENRRIILTNSEDADHYNNLKYEKGYEVEPKVIIKSKKRNWIKKIL